MAEIRPTGPFYDLPMRVVKEFLAPRKDTEKVQGILSLVSKFLLEFDSSPRTKFVTREDFEEFFRVKIGVSFNSGKDEPEAANIVSKALETFCEIHQDLL